MWISLKFICNINKFCINWIYGVPPHFIISFCNNFSSNLLILSAFPYFSCSHKIEIPIIYNLSIPHPAACFFIVDIYFLLEHLMICSKKIKQIRSKKFNIIIFFLLPGCNKFNYIETWASYTILSLYRISWCNWIWKVRSV